MTTADQAQQALDRALILGEQVAESTRQLAGRCTLADVEAWRKRREVDRAARWLLQFEVAGLSVAGSNETVLPDALLDDDAISPMAKMAYWYLKRHGGDVLVSDIARALRMDRQNPWVLLIELSDAGWITYPTIAQRVGGEDGGKARNGPRFTVHEVPVKREPRTATRAQIAESQRILDSAESRGAKR